MADNPLPLALTRRTLLSRLAGAGVGLLACQACAPQASTPPAPASTQAPVAPVAPTRTTASLKFGYNPILAGAPLYFAQDRGYFSAEGLQLEFTPFDSAALMTAPVSTGQLDAIPASPSPGLFNALARDVK